MTKSDATGPALALVWFCMALIASAPVAAQPRRPAAASSSTPPASGPAPTPTNAHAETLRAAAPLQLSALQLEDFQACARPEANGIGFASGEAFDACPDLQRLCHVATSPPGVISAASLGFDPTQSCAPSALRLLRVCTDAARPPRALLSDGCSIARQGHAFELDRSPTGRLMMSTATESNAALLDLANATSASSTLATPTSVDANILSGVTTFVLDRARQELITFLVNEIGTQVCGDDNPANRTDALHALADKLLPATCTALRTGASAVAGLPALLQDDLRDLPWNILKALLDPLESVQHTPPNASPFGGPTTAAVRTGVADLACAASVAWGIQDTLDGGHLGRALQAASELLDAAACHQASPMQPPFTPSTADDQPRIAPCVTPPPTLTPDQQRVYGFCIQGRDPAAVRATVWPLVFGLASASVLANEVSNQALNAQHGLSLDQLRPFLNALSVTLSAMVPNDTTDMVLHQIQWLSSHLDDFQQLATVIGTPSPTASPNDRAVAILDASMTLVGDVADNPALTGQGQTVATLHDIQGIGRVIDLVLKHDYVAALPLLFASPLFTTLEAALPNGSPAQQVVREIVQYGSLFATIANAQTPDQVTSALEAAAAPVGSYAQFRHQYWSGFIGALAGVAGGADIGVSPHGVGGFIAPFVPIGFEIGRGLGGPLRGSSINLFLSVLDIGALAAARLDGASTAPPSGTAGSTQVATVPTPDFATVLAPGAFVSLGIANTPLVVTVGGEWAPASNRYYYCTGGTAPCAIGAGDSVRAFVAVAVDLPTFRLF